MAKEEKGEVSNPPSNKKYILFVSGGFSLLVVFTLFYFIMNGEVKDSKSNEITVSEPVTEVVHLNDPDQVLSGAVFELSPFVLNLKNNSGILKMRVTLAFYEIELPSNMQSLIPRYRDRIIQIATSYEAPYLLKLSGKNEVKKKILEELNKEVSQDELIVGIYINEFTIR